MPKAIDVSGMRYGRLVVIRLQPYRLNDRRVWLCKCDCGNEVDVRQNNLQSGNTKSCGCLSDENRKDQSKKIINIKGFRSGRLVAKEMIEERATGGDVMWLCDCDCGNTTIAVGTQLRSGIRVSCGCQPAEAFAELRKTQFGKNHPYFNKDLTDLEREKRRKPLGSPSHDKLQQKVYARDRHTCDICGVTSDELVAHHLDGYAWHEKGRFEETNLITLCAPCHREYHRIHGIKNNTKEEYYDYKRRLT